MGGLSTFSSRPDALIEKRGFGANVGLGEMPASIERLQQNRSGLFFAPKGRFVSVNQSIVIPVHCSDKDQRRSAKCGLLAHLATPLRPASGSLTGAILLSSQ